MAKKKRRTGTRELSSITAGKRMQRLLLAEGPIKLRLANRVVDDLVGQGLREIDLALWKWKQPSRGDKLEHLSCKAAFLRRAAFYLTEAAHLCANVPAMEEAVSRRRPNRMTLKTARAIVKWHDLGKALERKQKLARVLQLVPLAGPGGAA